MNRHPLAIPPWRERFGRRDMARMALGLLVGAIGGAIAHWAGVPLAWMLGALFFCMFASLAGMPVDVPFWLRANFLILVGLFLGESFDGVTAAELAKWPLTLIGAIIYVPVAGAAAYLFYHFVMRQEVLTAICSAIPGGLTALVMISAEFGADERTVALSQSMRVAIVIFAAPLIAFGLLGFTEPQEQVLNARALISLVDFLVLITVAILACYALGAIGMPLPYMFGPVLASALLRMAGVVEGALPQWLVEAALVVTGSAIGCRFHGVSFGKWLGVAAATLVGTSIMMVVTLVFALAATAWLDIEFFAALLAYAPGGIAEMSLIALAIEADPSFVSVHHLIRICAILLVAPLFGAWLRRRVRR